MMKANWKRKHIKFLFISMPMPEVWDRTSKLLLLTFFDLKTTYLNLYTGT